MQLSATCLLEGRCCEIPVGHLASRCQTLREGVGSFTKMGSSIKSCRGEHKHAPSRRPHARAATQHTSVPAASSRCRTLTNCSFHQAIQRASKSLLVPSATGTSQPQQFHGTSSTDPFNASGSQGGDSSSSLVGTIDLNHASHSQHAMPSEHTARTPPPSSHTPPASSQHTASRHRHQHRLRHRTSLSVAAPPAPRAPADDSQPSTSGRMHPDELFAALQLSRRIKATSRWPALQHLLQQSSSQLNPIHLSLATTHLAAVVGRQRLSTRERLVMQDFVDWVVARAVAQLPAAGPKEVASLLLGLARLQHPVDDEAMEALLGRVQQLLHWCSSKELTLIIHSAAKLYASPSQAFADAFLAAWLAALPAASPEGMCKTLWALARLRLAPPQPWLAAWLQASGEQLEAFTAQGLAMCLWALATLQQPVPPAWLHQAKDCFLQQLPHANGHDASVVLWALTSASSAGSPSSSSSSRPSSNSSTSTSSTAGDGSGNSSARPDAEWMAAFIAGTEALLPRASPLELARLVRCLAVLEYRPPSAWLHALMGAVPQHVLQLAPQTLSNLMWGLVRLRVRPSSRWLDVVLLAAYEHLGAFAPQEMSNLLLALAHMRHIPPDLWVDAFWAESEPLLAACEPQHLANMLWALVELGQAPPQPWLDAWLGAASASLAQQTAQGLGMMAWPLRQLEPELPEAWLQEYCTAAAARWEQFDAMGLEALASVLGQLGHTPTAAWQAGFQQRALALLHSMNQHNLAGLLWGLSLMRGAAPEPAFLEQVYEAVGSQLESFSLANLSKVDRALSAWGSSMPLRWQRRMAALLSGAVPEAGAGAGAAGGPDAVGFLDT